MSRQQSTRTLRGLASFYKIPFHYFPVATAENRMEIEERELDSLKQNNIEFNSASPLHPAGSCPLCLVDQYPRRIINVHHSFLPAFTGAKPYHAAFQRGVKLIGATSHYVTEQLDEGPIIVTRTLPGFPHRDQCSRSLHRRGATWSAWFCHALFDGI